jgi:hypothetical protein
MVFIVSFCTKMKQFYVYFGKLIILATDSKTKKMNPLFKLLDDLFFFQIIRFVLSLKGDYLVTHTYADQLKQSITIRMANESSEEKPLIQINNDLSITFNEQRLTASQQKSVIDFLKGWGFPLT